LAPEYVAPAPIEDGTTVIRHLLANGTDRIVLCGDSAGGAIALAVEAGLPDDIRAHIAGVCSFHGAYGLFDTPSLLENGSRIDGTDVACVTRYFTLANRDIAENAYGLAALAKPSSVPVYLLAASDDPLRDDTLRLAEAFEACGRDITLVVVDNENHGFLHNAAVSSPASEAIAHIAAWIRRRQAD